MDKKQAYVTLLINSKKILNSFEEEAKTSSAYIEARRIYYLTFAGILRSNIPKEKTETEIKIKVNDVEYIAEINLIKQIMGNSYDLIEFINSNIEQNVVQEESTRNSVSVETSDTAKDDYNMRRENNRDEEQIYKERQNYNRDKEERRDDYKDERDYRHGRDERVNDDRYDRYDRDERRYRDRDEYRYMDRDRAERRYRDEREENYARRERRERDYDKREEQNVEVQKTHDIEIKPNLVAAVPVINKEETIIEEKLETEVNNVEEKNENEVIQESDNVTEDVAENVNDIQANEEEVSKDEDASIDKLWFEKYEDDIPDAKLKTSLLFDEYLFKIEKNSETEYVRVIVYPMYYCYDEHISTSVLVGMESDSICRVYISEGDTKNIKASFNEDNFIIRGKWVDGQFNSQVYYSKKKPEEVVSFEKKEYRPEEPTKNTHLIMNRLTDKVHVFPLSLTNDNRTGLTLAVAYSEEENTLLLPMKNGLLPLSKKDNYIVQPYWVDNNRKFVCRE